MSTALWLPVLFGLARGGGKHGFARSEQGPETKEEEEKFSMILLRSDIDARAARDVLGSPVLLSSIIELALAPDPEWWNGTARRRSE